MRLVNLGFGFPLAPGSRTSTLPGMSDLTFPFTVLGGYISKLRNGENIDRNIDAIVRERERITAEYRGHLEGSERQQFDELIRLARTVVPLVENHNFYCEHFHHSLFWNKVRELGRVIRARRYLDDPEEIFLFHRWEIHELLWDLVAGWALDGPPDRSDYWRREAKKRSGGGCWTRSRPGSRRRHSGPCPRPLRIPWSTCSGE